jgi:hypothetical protein
VTGPLLLSLLSICGGLVVIVVAIRRTWGPRAGWIIAGTGIVVVAIVAILILLQS